MMSSRANRLRLAVFVAFAFSGGIAFADPPAPKASPGPDTDIAAPSFGLRPEHYSLPMNLNDGDFNWEVLPIPPHGPVPDMTSRLIEHRGVAHLKLDESDIWVVTRPLVPDEINAADHCPLAPPGQAKNVLFLNVNPGGHDYYQLVRFEAPVDVCRAFAAWECGKRTFATAPDLTPAKPVPLDKKLAASLAKRAASGNWVGVIWFDTDQVRQGEMYGDHRPGNPLFIVDTERGVLYYVFEGEAGKL